MDVIIGILIPFIGTVLGSLSVLFLRKNINEKLEKALYGFASGVMLAASIWSLIIPALEIGSGIFKVVPVVIGIIIGILMFIFIEKINVKNKSMLSLAVTLHNIPEGVAVGVVFASIFWGNSVR